MLKNHVARTRMANNNSRKNSPSSRKCTALDCVILIIFVIGRRFQTLSSRRHRIRSLVVRSFVSPVTTDERARTSLKLEES